MVKNFQKFFKIARAGHQFFRIITNLLEIIKNDDKLLRNVVKNG